MRKQQAMVVSPFCVLRLVLGTGERLPCLVDRETWLPARLATRWAMRYRRYRRQSSTCADNLRILGTLYAWARTSGGFELDDYLIQGNILTSRQIEAFAATLRLPDAFNELGPTVVSESVFPLIDAGTVIYQIKWICVILRAKKCGIIGESFPTNISSFSRKESMSLNILLPNLPDCSVEQVSQTEETIVITASATTSFASCPDCQHVSSQVHSTYIRSPKTLPSSGRPVRLQLQVRRFCCANPTCRRKTFAETFPLLIVPRAQRTSAAQEMLRVIGEAIGGRAGARLSQQFALKCSPATVLRLVRQAPLPSSKDVRVVGVDEWAWRKGQRYGTILVDLERHAPIDLLEDATAESFAAWLEKHPTREVVSRDRGTTFADGANRGAPQALQIADRWHIINTMGEALEKVLARHHADLKRVMAPAPEEEQQIIAALDQQVLARTLARSQTELHRQARQERRRAIFMRVQALAVQGWSGASIARMLGIHKKTAVKYAQMEHFPDERSDRGRKLAPYLPFLHTQWSAGEQNIAFLYQAIRTQGYTGSETAVRNHLTALRKQIGQEGQPRRYYPPVSGKKKHHQRAVLSNANRMGVLDSTCYDIGCLLEAHRLCTEDDTDPVKRFTFPSTTPLFHFRVNPT